MSDRRVQVQVGALFILSLTVLIAGILWFKEFRIGEKNYLVTVEFPQTSGLVKGDAVEVKGVPSGKVDDIRFEGGRALVTIQLERGVTFHPGTRISIANVGLMGQKVVSIYPGDVDRPAFPADTLLTGSYSSGIPEVLAGVGGTLATFERLAIRVDSLLVAFDKPKQEQVTRTLENIERATGELAVILEENRDDLVHSIRDMRDVMGELKVMMDGKGETFSRAIEDAGSAAARLDTTLATLDSTVTRVDRLLSRVENGEGTLGKALQDQVLYDELVLTLEDAKLLLEDVRRNPKRYFKFSIF